MNPVNSVNPLTKVAENQPTRATILLIDNEPMVLEVLSDILRADYRVQSAPSGEEALKSLKQPALPDLILLDILMPGLDGYEVLAYLRSNPHYRHIPVICLTALNSHDHEQRGLSLGAVDYIIKPSSPAIILARVRTQLELKWARDSLARQNVQLEQLVSARTASLQQALDSAHDTQRALQQSYLGTLHALSALVELRHSPIKAHSQRVASLSRQVASKLGMSPGDSQMIYIAGLLHDVGRIALPDALLDKNVSEMSTDEQALFRQHPDYAANVLGNCAALHQIAHIVRCHHEHFDGSGYPRGLAGEQIPLGARIVLLISDYDDLHYGNLTHQPLHGADCLAQLTGRQRHYYDPAILEVFCTLLAFIEQGAQPELKLPCHRLAPGMLLNRDVKHPNGFLLLARSSVLNTQQIERLKSLEKSCGNLDIYVVQPDTA